MNENENREKTPEEIYLDELYNAMIDGKELSDGTIPLQIPTLDSKQQFRKIELPVKRKKTIFEHAATSSKVLSIVYLIVGLLVYKEATGYDVAQTETFELLFLVFAIGAVFAAIAVVLVLTLKDKITTSRKFSPFILLAACIIMLVLVS